MLIRTNCVLTNFVVLIIFINFLSKGLAEISTKSDNPNEIHSWILSDKNSLKEIRNQHSKTMQSFMDSSVDPCDDFYSYACGNWGKVHPIPEDSSEHNVFSTLTTKMLDSLKNVLSQPFEQNVDSAKSSDLNAEDKSKLFVSTCTDLKTINQRGNEPLLNFINSLGGWPVLDNDWNETNFDLIELCAKSTQLGQHHFFDMSVEMDWKNSNEYAISISSSLGFDNPYDYIVQENTFRLAAYKNLIIAILKLLNVENEKAEKTANEIINFETVLANFSIQADTNDQISANYFGTTLGELTDNNPLFNLTRYLNLVFGKTLSSDQYLVLLQFDNFNEMMEFVATSDKRLLANYIIWRHVLSTYGYLGDDFLAAKNTFNKALTGQIEPQPRWKICVEQINEQMDMAVGAQYIRAYFDESSKKDVEMLTKEIFEIFEGIIHNLSWIDDETKQKCEQKVKASKMAIGYSDFILSIENLNKIYNSLNIQNEKHFENSVNLKSFHSEKSIKKINKNVDKGVWPISPATVNAFFETTKNRIVIPAGILQPPIYHRGLPKALNYGAIGAFIGHEITHGFDVSGREFDFDGNMNAWWSNNSIEYFDTKANCFADQYSNYSIDGKFISGSLSKSESIADNGGIRQSFIAYTNWRKIAKVEDLKNEEIPNLNMTHNQLFFMGFAQSWCNQIRPEALEHKILVDSHCPGKFRVIGALSNFEAFSNAYQCPLGSTMNPTEKCKLW